MTRFVICDPLSLSLLNEAALVAARRDRDEITASDIDEAPTKPGV